MLTFLAHEAVILVKSGTCTPHYALRCHKRHGALPLRSTVCIHFCFYYSRTGGQDDCVGIAVFLFFVVLFFTGELERR